MGSKGVVMPKREDCELTKLDSEFSDWKVLIGPSDWEDHSLGREGSERYSVHNLPKSPGPGVYELGIAPPSSKAGHEVSKLDSNHTLPVYVGHADNVKTRLQQYGRSGAHFCKGLLTNPSDDSKECLFREAFSRGYSIVYRWVPMDSKEEAQEVEAQLLNTYDYPWNKGSNGARRPHDVFKKPGESSGTKKLPSSHRRQAGIEVGGRHTSPDNRTISHNDEKTNGFNSGIFKFNRTQPRLVSYKPDCADDVTKFCGVALDEGSICRRPPVEGRKRCEEHKGMRTLVSYKPDCADDLTKFCGVALDEGSICRRPPVEGRKRCEEHKGMRTNGVKNTSPCEKSGTRWEELDGIYSPFIVPGVGANSPICDRISPVCGVILDDGSSCGKQPAQGRKRCTEHKGMRIKEPDVFSSKGALPDIYASTTSYKSRSHISMGRGAVTMDRGNICGVDRGDGTLCTRQPPRGRVRCEYHKGMRIR